MVFRASFYWTEGDDREQEGVPVELTVKINAFRRAMSRIGSGQQHCVALSGMPGRAVFCTIYDRRPSVCRDFEPSWSSGVANPHCDRARAAAIGLAPLQPDFRVPSHAA